MMSFGPLAFAAPWILAALVALPGLWWLLRLTPPPARRQSFPALRLLMGLAPVDDSPARTPLWLLVLRLAIGALLIVGLARPVWHPPPRLAGGGPLLLLVDDGWAAGRDWPARRRALDQAMDQADREGRTVALLTTAPDGMGTTAPEDRRERQRERMIGPLPAAQMRRLTQALAPHPWPGDRAAALATLRDDATRVALTAQGSPAILWLSDGVDDGAVTTDGTPVAAALSTELQALGALTVLDDGPERPALLIQPPENAPDGTGGDVRVSISRSDTRPPLPVRVEGQAADGHVVADAAATFAPGQGRLDLTLPLPLELRNELASLRLAGPPAGAGAVALLDGRWRRRAVGLIDPDAVNGGGVGGIGDAQPLLSPFHYLEQALAPFAEVRRAPLDDLLNGDSAVLVLTDRDGLTATDRAALGRWVDAGGLLLRFAGPRLADAAAGGSAAADGTSEGDRSTGSGQTDHDQTGAPADDPLLPVPLRAGDRSLGGALSWTEPARLAPFDVQSPFAGLTAPPDVTISRQVLAQPSPDLDGRVWARLEDGTPLVTARPLGRGRVVLVHTTPDPRWSNLALSGLFIALLHRIVDLSDGKPAAHGDTPLPPLELLDGEGRLAPPPPSALPLPPPPLPAAQADDATGPRVDPRHPPGYYGSRDARMALNLAPAVATLGALPPPDGTGRPYDADGTRDLAPSLLVLAFAGWLLDLLASLPLRGLIPSPNRRRSGAAGMVALALLLAGGLPSPPAVAAAAAGAASGAASGAAGDLAGDVAAATRNWLAYVVTGDSATDATSRAGLSGLATQLNRRTAVEIAGVRAVDVERDDLAFYPLLYWAVTPGEPAPSEAAARRINRYLHAGGLILFDTRDPNGATGGSTGDGSGQAALRTVTRGLDIPRLAVVDSRHVLGRSFFLLQEFPGRLGDQPVWAEAGEGQANDGVSSVLIGANDWAGAWAVDAQGRPLNAVTPGGERQRELAYRFGINVVMYALTGNYKADQVHVPAILERLGQ